MNGTRFIIVPLCALILSGCSIAPKVAKPVPEGPDVPGGLSATVEKGSIWKSDNGGEVFFSQSKVDETTRIEKADILSIAYHPQKPASVFVGTVENGIFKTENGGDTWQQIVFPPKKIYSFIPDKNDPDKRMFASGVLGDQGKMFRTDDGGANWKDIYSEPGQGTFVSALSQHFSDRNVIFAGTSTGTVVKSVDGGNTWKNIGNKIDGSVSDIAFDSKKKLVTYLLAAGRKLYYSPDGGARWLDWEEEKKNEVKAIQEAASKLSAKGDTKGAEKKRQQAKDLSERNQENKMPSGIISVASDPTVSGVVYVGTSTGLFRSADYGKYWYELNIIESAKKFPIRSIAVNPKNPKEVVFVAGKAFYKSINGGETWAITSLSVDRDAAFVAYDPFDPKYLLIGLRSFKK
jgi:photosystem II stability/assembly factor-like uncharacterized protein